MIGCHCIKHYSRTQAVVTLSSAEAELAACVKASAEVKGLQNLCKDLGFEVSGQVWLDASAALGVVTRRGCGRVKHLETQWLWVQQAHRSGSLTYCKVNTQENPADVLTKAVGSDLLFSLLRAVGFNWPCADSAWRAGSEGGVRDRA